MSEKQIKILTTLAKLAGVFTAISAKIDILPEKYSWIGVLIVVSASTLKDMVSWLGDLWDDGKLNKSFKGIVPLLILTAVLFGMTGCDTLKGMAVKRTPVELKPAATNYVEMKVTNTVERTVYVTNLVTVVEARTNEAGVVTPAVLQPQILPQIILAPQITTSSVPVVTPAVIYDKLELGSGVKAAVNTAGDLAPFPFAKTITGGLLAVSTVVLGFFTRKNAAKAKAAAEKRDEALSALEQAKLLGKVLVENVEEIRQVALTVPAYREKDAQVMKIVQKVQAAAGVKEEVEKLVDAHTDYTTKPATD